MAGVGQDMTSQVSLGLVLNAYGCLCAPPLRVRRLKTVQPLQRVSVTARAMAESDLPGQPLRIRIRRPAL